MSQKVNCVQLSTNSVLIVNMCVGVWLQWINIRHHRPTVKNDQWSENDVQIMLETYCIYVLEGCDTLGAVSWHRSAHTGRTCLGSELTNPIPPFPIQNADVCTLLLWMRNSHYILLFNLLPTRAEIYNQLYLIERVCEYYNVVGQHETV